MTRWSAGVVKKPGWQERAVRSVVGDTPAVIVRANTPFRNGGMRQRGHRSAGRRQIHPTNKLGDHVAVAEKAHVEWSLGAHRVGVHRVRHRRLPTVEMRWEVPDTPMTRAQALQHCIINLNRNTQQKSLAEKRLMTSPAPNVTTFIGFQCDNISGINYVGKCRQPCCTILSDRSLYCDIGDNHSLMSTLVLALWSDNPVTVGSHSVAVCGPAAWNSLLAATHDLSSSSSCFYSRVKTELLYTRAADGVDSL